MNRGLEIQTHLAIDRELSGEPIELTEGRAVVRLQTTRAMSADGHGLVHGGFVFSLADHAAMLAVNQPTVVLGAASTRFLAPTRVGEILWAEAVVERAEGKKHDVRVEVRPGTVDGADGEPTFSGSFTCFVPSRHVLES
ncbi:MAG: PaaI family thioesterase [Acidobacteriota bacterium]